MASIKKQLKGLLDRFEVAQEAFVSNSVDLKKLSKRHKKELQAARKEARAARVEVEALKAELAILRSQTDTANESARRSTTRKTTTAKRGPGRPRKAITAAGGDAPKRGPGRPRKTTTAKAKPAARKRKPKGPVSPLVAISGVGATMAAQFEAAGAKSPADVANMNNDQMAEVMAKCGPRYRNATPEKMQAIRDAAKAAG